MTLPSAESDLLMAEASFSVCPWASDCFARSDPAKSTCRAPPSEEDAFQLAGSTSPNWNAR
eukprot:8735440-Pyramimonas_sp.AAC.2